MKYMSLFSGIEAATVAWHPLGWKPLAFAEVDKFASAVLAHHYPDVPNLGDVTKHKDWPIYEPDVIVGGSPCQPFSVAGLRKGLDDPRGNLTLTYLAVVEQYRPRWVVWENVPGVLSIDGGVFGTFLGALGQLGYGFAYRVLDAQYFGVPQRRRRVFVVGHLGDWRRAAAVLFERHSLQGHPAPSRKAREESSCGAVSSLDASFGRLQGCSGQDANHGHSHLIAHALKASTGGVSREDQHTLIAFGGNNTSGPIEVATACRAKGGSGHGDFESETLVAHALRGEGFDVGEDGTGRGTPLVPVAGAICRDSFIGGAGGRPEGAEAGHFIPVVYSIMPMNSCRDYKARVTDIAQPVMAGGPVGGNQGGDYIIQPLPFDTTQVTSAANRSAPMPGDPCHPLAAGAHAPAIAFDCKASGRNGFGVGDIAPTLRDMGHSDSHSNAGGQVAVAFRSATEFLPQSSRVYSEVDAAPTLQASGQRMGNRAPQVQQSMRVRRLTPRECERLQGFPDDYTLIVYRKKPAADGPRYKALGNSMAVPVMRWIGQRIQMVEAISAEE